MKKNQINGLKGGLSNMDNDKIIELLSDAFNELACARNHIKGAEEKLNKIEKMTGEV